MKKYVVAVVGATGVVGKEMIEVLEKRNFPIETLLPLASERSIGMVAEYKGEPIDIEVLNDTSFKGVDFALFSAGSEISKKYAPIAVKSGTIVIDNTSYYRMQKDVPLVVPEVNEADLAWHKGIIANPNCSTAQLVVVLKPIHDAAKIKRVVISTYQSVSGAGKEAILELENQARANLSGQVYQPKKFAYPIAFNVIPQIDSFTENGYTKEELKMVNETKKIMNDQNIKLTATTVRVPVFVGHSESVNIETEKKLTVEEIKALLSSAPGVKVVDDPAKGLYPTPRDCAGLDEVLVGRIREDISIANGIDLWIVADNLRKGAALNAVQIAECLIKN
ncbi:MAG: aspartate-semialdehyde dehydrogenase [Candidatus Margulisiibacteriota bacterium]|jgi:aspartate-semialdehyde dehydrogenase